MPSLPKLVGVISSYDRASRSSAVVDMSGPARFVCPVCDKLQLSCRPVMTEYLDEVTLKLGDPVVTLLEDAADGGRFDRQKLRDFAQRITQDKPNKVLMRHKVRMEQVHRSHGDEMRGILSDWWEVGGLDNQSSEEAAYHLSDLMAGRVIGLRPLGSDIRKAFSKHKASGAQQSYQNEPRATQTKLNDAAVEILEKEVFNSSKHGNDLPINLAHKLGIGDQYEIWLEHESQGAGPLQKARKLIRTWESQSGDAATTQVMLAALGKLNMNQIINDLHKVL